MIEPLTDVEIRVLGALVEKAVTTPEYYPLTLNALTNACNQKSNRDPVVAYESGTVGQALNTLKARGLVRIIMGGDSRVPKYQQYFAEAYDVAPLEEAILAELMLRGPQTPGELRGRVERFGQEVTVDDIETTITTLMQRSEPLVVRLPRQPGRKESRLMQLLGGPPTEEMLQAVAERDTTAPAARVDASRFEELEAEVRALRLELEALREELAAFRTQFE